LPPAREITSVILADDARPAPAQSGDTVRFVSTSPLNGLRVLDLATLFPAPLLAAMLGDLGADVVKVEPPEGDPLRRVGPVSSGTPVAWALAGRNKRSVVADAAGALELAAVADVVVVNQPSHVLDRNGWDHDSVRARNARVVYVSVTAFGATGPYRDRPGNGSIAEAFSGFAHLNGDADGPPVLPSLALGDTLAAIAGVGRVVAALYARDVAGAPGAYVDLAIFEPLLELSATSIAAWSPDAPSPHRSGSRLASAAPRNVYRCADGTWVAISGPTDQQVARVLGVIDRAHDLPGWEFAHQRVGDAADRLDTAVADWIATRDHAEVVAAFLAARVPVAPVNDLAALAADEHVQVRGSLGAALGTPHRPAPEVGEHTAEVRAEWLRVR
jgi:crotonobetainyl-CoA:carnitine CoA-transferase CaiB-like acyl-CoA transferase